MLSSWSKKVAPGQNNYVEWKKESPQSLLHITMACFSDYDGKPSKEPTFIFAKPSKTNEKNTMCILRQGLCENQSLELFFEHSVQFSATGPYAVQIMGQVADPSNKSSPVHQINHIGVPSGTRSSRIVKPLSQNMFDVKSDDSDDEDYQPGNMEGEDSDDEDEDEDEDEVEDEDEDKEVAFQRDFGETLQRDAAAASGKRKVVSDPQSSAKKKRKTKNENSSVTSSGSGSSSSTSSDSSSDENSGSESDDEDDKSTQKINSSSSVETVSQQLVKTLQSMNKARSGAGAGDIGTKFRDLYGKSFKEAAGMKLTKYVKQNTDKFELTADNLCKIKRE
jgi:hypothetical protein